MCSRWPVIPLSDPAPLFACLAPHSCVSFNPVVRMNDRGPAILDHLASLADTTRSRILLLLDPHAITVSELCGILQLPQSTVSRHLKALADAGWIASRAEGTSNLYTMSRGEMDGSARRLWLLV